MKTKTLKKEEENDKEIEMKATLLEIKQRSTPLTKSQAEKYTKRPISIVRISSNN